MNIEITIIILIRTHRKKQQHRLTIVIYILIHNILYTTVCYQNLKQYILAKFWLVFNNNIQLYCVSRES